jgi:TPR repeat protein
MILGVRQAVIVLLLSGAAIPESDPIADARLAITAKDHARAREILRPPADAGSADAQLLLGELLEKGLGGEEDPKAAAAMYSTAAQAGSAEARFRLGCMRLEGRGVAQTPSAAADEWQAAAEAGHVAAQYRLGALLVDSAVFKHRRDEGGRWLLAAASAGSWDAQYKLIVLYDEGGYVDGLERSMRHAWVAAGARRGHADAQYRLGQDLFENRREQISWFRMAARQGHTAAMVRLGECLKYYSREEQTRALELADLEEARRWLLTAAEEGEAEAAYVLSGLVLDDRLAQERRRAESHAWLTVHIRMAKALRAGTAKERKSRERFARSFFLEPKELSRARERAEALWELVKDGVERRKR